MVVLDLLARDERIRKITLVDPDVFKSHNAVRHFFTPADAGAAKVDLAARWIKGFRPELEVVPLAVDLMETKQQALLEEAVRSCDIGVCAVDNEPAKFHFDALMRQFNRPWTLGEVLSGGIGGWVHRFLPGEACYGCVASHLQRAIQTENTPPPDYSNPGATVEETRIPANKASICAIASLHAILTLNVLDNADAGFSSLLLPLAKVDGIFSEPFKPFRFRIARSPDCLICGLNGKDVPAGEDLDVALDQAIARLGHG